MITAGLLYQAGLFTCCVLDETRHPRYLTARRTDKAREAICCWLSAARVDEVSLIHTAQDLDPIGLMMLRLRLDVWLAPAHLVDDLAAVLGRRAGSRTRAAILARMTSNPTWFAAMRPLPLPLAATAQLSLL